MTALCEQAEREMTDLENHLAICRAHRAEAAAALGFHPNHGT